MLSPTQLLELFINHIKEGGCECILRCLGPAEVGMSAEQGTDFAGSKARTIWGVLFKTIDKARSYFFKGYKNI